MHTLFPKLLKCPVSAKLISVRKHDCSLLAGQLTMPLHDEADLTLLKTLRWIIKVILGKYYLLMSTLN